MIRLNFYTNMPSAFHWVWMGVIIWVGMLSSCTSPIGTEQQQTTAIPVKVVVVSMFELGELSGDRPGEFQYWVENVPLSEEFKFPQGNFPLRYNADKRVLGLVTGIGTANAAASVMALGMDERFDLTNAYWLVAGIAGIDPEDGSTGSAVWAKWVVDGDLGHEIDREEVPLDWETGYIPLRKTYPYEQPIANENAAQVFQLNEGLVNWAYELTKEVALVDNEQIQGMRKLYVDHEQAQLPPRVLIGDQLAASTYWHGAELNAWANEWVKYWTKGEGNFVTSAMEDSGTLQALSMLDQADKVDVGRVLVLRTASNFTMQYPGITAVESLSGEKLAGKGYTAFIPSLEAAFNVGNVVVNEIVEHWDRYRDQMPTP